MDLAHIARDHQNLVGLEFHERRRRNEAIHRHCPPVNSSQDVIHFLDPWNAFEGDSGIEQALEIDFVRVFLQKENILTHDESPDRVIDRRILVVALIDGELQKMIWQRLHRLICLAELHASSSQFSPLTASF